MVKSQKQSKRKPSGARLSVYRKKRSYELGRPPRMTKIAEKRVKTIGVMGGNDKKGLLACDVANLFDPSKKKFSKVKIVQVIENPANRHFIRRNIMTKGTIIETEVGKARVTSRPGQEPFINAVLI